MRSDCPLNGKPKPKKGKGAGKPLNDVAKAELAAMAAGVPEKRVSTGPVEYSPELLRVILDHLANGKSLLAISRMPGMPHRATMAAWRDADRDGFADSYARACEEGLHVMAEEMIDIADDSSGDVTVGPEGGERFDSEFAARSKIRIETRKWILERRMRHVYGNHVSIDANINDKNIEDMTDEEINARIAAAIASGTGAATGGKG